MKKRKGLKRNEEMKDLFVEERRNEDKNYIKGK